MRLFRILVLVGAVSAAAVACDTGDVRDTVNGARSSAASAAAGTKQACQASKTTVATLGDEAQQLADNPGLRTTLAPQIRDTADKLVSQLGSRPEFGGMVAAARDLTSALGTANTTRVEAAAKQAVVAVKGVQGVCDLAT